jgi:hypothetical protein
VSKVEYASKQFHLKTSKSKCFTRFTRVGYLLCLFLVESAGEIAGENAGKLQTDRFRGEGEFD